MSDNPGATLGVLIKQVLVSAEKFILASEPMRPFAITVVPDGQGQLIVGAPDANPNEVLSSFYFHFQELAKARKLTAFGVGVEVTVTNKETGKLQDAVRINMEHFQYVGGEACIVPFSREGGAVKWGKLLRVSPCTTVWLNKPQAN